MVLRRVGSRGKLILAKPSKSAALRGFTVRFPGSLLRKKKHPRGAGVLFSLVEPRGIEPLSEKRAAQFSPSAADDFTFPLPAAGRQAAGVGSHWVMTAPVTGRRSRSPLIDASHPAAVFRVATAA